MQYCLVMHSLACLGHIYVALPQVTVDMPLQYYLIPESFTELLRFCRTQEERHIYYDG